MSLRRTSSRILMPIVALAVLLQLAVPHGWMVAAAEGGTATLVPCPSVSPELAALRKTDPDRAPTVGGEHAGHHAQHGAQPLPPDPHALHGQHASGHVSAADTPDGDGSEHEDHSGLASALCDFAALGAPAMLPSPPALDLPPFPATDPAPLARRALAPGRGLAAPPPPSTGPPTTA